MAKHDVTEEASETDDEVLQPDELAGLRLAASRSLLSERRRGQRRGFLVDSVLTVLGHHGGRKEEYVKAAVRDLWASTTITDILLDQAIAEAEAAGLVSRQPTLDGREKLEVSAQAKEDAQLDRKWVEDQFTALVNEVRVRAIGMEDESYLADHVTAIVDHLVEALAHACDGESGAAASSSPHFVRPVRLDLQALQQFCDSLDDKRLRSPVRLLSEAALDESDAFGNALVHLVLVGSLLHSVVVQRLSDGARPTLEGTRLLVDASVLVDLASPPDSAAHQLLVGLIDATCRLGACVSVGPHTVEEWNGLWAAADREMALVPRDFPALPEELHRWVSNPFVLRYLEARSNGSTEPWKQWRKRHRGLATLLKDTGAELFQGDHGGGDRMDDFLDALEYENARRSTKRAPNALTADARSCDLIAGWRADGETAYFLSGDTLSPRAYRRVTSDELPLTIEPRSWALYTMHLLTDDPDEAVSVADLVGRVVARDAILSMASSYPLDWIVDFATLLEAQNSKVSAEELRDLDAVQLSMIETIDALDREAASENGPKGAELAHSLASRRLARAEVERRRQQERDRQHTERLAANQAELDAERSRNAHLEARLTSVESNLRDEKSDRERSESIQGRRRSVWAAALVGFLLAIALGLGGLASPLGVVIAVLSSLTFLLLGLNWSEGLERSWAFFVRSVGAVGVIELLAILIG